MPGWDLSAVTSPPTFDTGLIPVEQVLTPKIATLAYLLACYVNNPTGASILFTLKNAGGREIVGPVEVPAGEWLPPYTFPFMPCAGLSWIASGPGLNGQLWGNLPV
jgi:hypothetical protein